MPPKKFALGGEPDFHNIKDQKLMGYIDFAQDLIFAYRGYDKSVEEVLARVWKDLTNEHSDRVSKGLMSYGERLDHGFEYNYKMPWDEGYSATPQKPKETKTPKKDKDLDVAKSLAPKRMFKPKR